MKVKKYVLWMRNCSTT